MKTWETPKLIVLVRKGPQEAVLDVCKGAPILAAGVVPSADFNSCQETPILAMALCFDCFTISNT